MNTLINFIIGFLSAALGAMGMGGGGILLIYLSAILGIEQLVAQGMNLFFFLPIAVIALCFHLKNKYISYKTALFSILGGVAGVFLGKYIAEILGNDILKKAFAIFLFIIGLKELFGKVKNESDSNQKS